MASGDIQEILGHLFGEGIWSNDLLKVLVGCLVAFYCLPVLSIVEGDHALEWVICAEVNALGPREVERLDDF